MAAASGSDSPSDGPSPSSSGNALSSGAEKSSNFSLGFALLPAAKREALSAVYAYCRLIDDVVDDGALPKEEARQQLAFWREEIERLYAGHPSHALTRRLSPSVRAFKLPKEPFLEMIRGCEMDLDVSRYKDFAALEPYLQGVACSVGRLSVEIFGYAHTPKEKIAEFARLFGYAFQLTNIARDVGADLELGRVYLPEDEMERFGVSREMLLRREHTPWFNTLMRFQYERAKRYYREARALVDPRDLPSLLPAEIMAHIYEGVLDEIERGGFRVLFQKTQLSRWKKVRLSLSAWLYCHGLR